MSKNSQPARTTPMEEKSPDDAPTATGRSKGPIALLVVAVFIGFVAIKLVSDGVGTAPSPASEGAPAGTTITSVRNDAAVDYDAAVASGKPIYVLFHSLTCEPCVEISSVADEVLPDYEGDVVFVNAITDDPSGQQLAANFAFQYIPTSFFLSAGGAEVVDSFTGAMGDAQMRAYLDALVQAR